MTDMLTYIVDVVEMPDEVRDLMAEMFGDAVAQNGCLIIEEDTWEQFVNEQLETARIQDIDAGLGVEQVFDDPVYVDNPEYDEMLFHQYLATACCNCGGPCEPGTCEVLTENEWSVNYG
jgi:hypothetical protein